MFSVISVNNKNARTEIKYISDISVTDTTALLFDITLSSVYISVPALPWKTLLA